MAILGFVGLGLMGSRIVKRLLDAGHQVTGYNRTRAKAAALLGAGMPWCNTPREGTEAADITFSMVSDTAALSSIANGQDGVLAGLSAGKIAGLVNQMLATAKTLGYGDQDFAALFKVLAHLSGMSEA